MIIIPIWIYKWGIFNDHHIIYRSPILFPSDKSWEAALLDFASRRLSAALRHARTAVGQGNGDSFGGETGGENGRWWPWKPGKTMGKTRKNQEKPGKTRKNHGKFMEIWDFSTELGKKSFNVRELVGWTRKQQEREGSNPLRLSKLGYPVCISKRFGVLLFATRHINIVP